MTNLLSKKARVLVNVKFYAYTLAYFAAVLLTNKKVFPGN
jgi:hypothetical protein